MPQPENENQSSELKKTTENNNSPKPFPWPDRYFFGRVNVIANYDDKLKFFLDALSKPTQLFWHGINWCFVEINKIEHSNTFFLTGYLVKFKTTDEEIVKTTNTNISISEASIKDHLIAKSRFFFHVTSGIISYNPVSNHLTDKLFRSIFPKLIMHAYSNFFTNVEIKPIDCEYVLLDEIKRFCKISKISIKLHPSNPNSKEMWKRVDERMKKLRATKYSEEIESKAADSSLDIKDDDETLSKIAMAEDGYGAASIEGIYESKPKIIKSGKSPISEEVPGNSTVDQIISIVFNRIKQILKRK